MLGALMIDNRLVDEVQRLIRADHFLRSGPWPYLRGDHPHWSSIANMIANPVTLKPIVESDEGLKEAGGASYLAKLTESGRGR